MDRLSGTGGVVASFRGGHLNEDFTQPMFRKSAGAVFKATVSAPLPAAFDTRLPEFFPVRDQGNQGSCVAFASMKITQNEEHYDTSNLREPLSPQYIYNQRTPL